MKQLYLFLILLVYNLSSAQDPRIFENTWYLTKLNENGVDYFPPNNPEAANIPLTVDESGASFQTNMCNYVFATIGFENNITDFTLSNVSVTLGWCNDSSNDSFDNLYIGFFLANAEPNYYTYTISEVNNVRTLVITNLGGYQAIYSDVMLSLKESKMENVSIYPNPALDYINVKLGAGNPEDAEVEIYDSLGKLCRVEKIRSGTDRISVADLSAGVYLIRVSSDEGTILRKCVKL